MSLWNVFEYRLLAVFEGKCRQFRNSSECLKTHSGANIWPIWTQKVPTPNRSVKMYTTNFYKSFSKNILLYMSSWVSKTSSVHTYVMIRTVYFGWICRYCLPIHRWEPNCTWNHFLIFWYDWSFWQVHDRHSSSWRLDILFRVGQTKAIDLRLFRGREQDGTSAWRPTEVVDMSRHDTPPFWLPIWSLPYPENYKVKKLKMNKT